MIGLACVSQRLWSKAANLDQVFVHPDYRRWGIGTQLVNHAIAHARTRDVHTLMAEAPITNPVLMVYLKAGFRVSGFLDAYYSPDGSGPVTAMFLVYDLRSDL